MIIFWRDSPLTDSESALVDALSTAHRRCAMRGNASTVALKSSAGGSGSFEMALASAVLTLGGKHAPVRTICQLLDRPISKLFELVEERLCNKERIPGWGSSFFKDKPDPDLRLVKDALDQFPEMATKLAQVTNILHEYKKPVFPNAGAYTAATAIVVGIPAEVASYLLIEARLPVWAEMAQKAM